MTKPLVDIMNLDLTLDLKMLNQSVVPLGSSLCEKIENDPNSFSKVDSEVDLLKDYNKKTVEKKTDSIIMSKKIVKAFTRLQYKSNHYLKPYL